MSETSISSYWAELAKVAAAAPSELQPGDVILTSSAEKTPFPGSKANLVSRAMWGAEQVGYRALSPRLQGTLTHAMIYAGDGTIVESADSGVVKRPFRTATKGKAYAVLRPNVSSDVREKAAQFAREQTGKPYDMAGMLGAGASLFLPQKVSNWVLKSLISTPTDPSAQQAFQCAALVSAAYEAAGAPVADSVSWRVASPAHLLGSKQLEKVKLVRKRHEVRAPGVLSRHRHVIRETLEG